MATIRERIKLLSQSSLTFGLLSALLICAGCGRSKATRSLDQLNPEQIPSELRFPNQPPEVVAILASKSGMIGIIGIGFSPDGTCLAGGSGNGHLVVWNSGTQAVIADTKAHDLPISTILFTPDGKLIDACYDHTARIWRLENEELKPVATLSGHTDQIWGMALSPDGKTLATASTDKTVRLWNLAASPPKEIGLIENNESAWSVSFAPDGRTLACTFGDDIRLWDISGDKPKPTTVLKGHKGNVWRVAFSPDGKTLASTGDDKTVRLWKIGGDKPSEPVTLSGHNTNSLYGLTFSPDGKSLISADDSNGVVILWDPNAGTERKRWQLPEGLRQATFASDSRHVALSSDKDRVYILRIPQ